MKSEAAVPVLIAVIAAFASVMGVLYNQHGALKLEREKWRQSVLDDRSKREREALTSFAKEFSAAYYLAEEFLWRVEMMSSSLTGKDFADYGKASDFQKPKLAAVEVQLAATSYAHYIRVAPLLREYRRIDEQIVVAGPQFKKNRESVLSLLDGEAKKLNDFQQQMVNSLSDAQELTNNSAAEER